MLPPRASVAAEQGLKEKHMMLATAATLAQGDIEVEAGRRAALGGVADRQSVRPQRQSKSPSLAKTVTAAAWKVKVNCTSTLRL